MDKKSNNVAIVKKNLYGEKALVIFLLIILFTVCAINSDLWQGVVTAKYFYFACVIAISVAGVAIWYIRRQLQLFVIRFTDVSVAIFFIYVVIHQFMNSGIFGVQWYLFLLMFPLYFLVRTFNMQHATLFRCIADALFNTVVLDRIRLGHSSVLQPDTIVSSSISC